MQLDIEQIAAMTHEAVVPMNHRSMAITLARIAREIEGAGGSPDQVYELRAVSSDLIRGLVEQLGNQGHWYLIDTLATVFDCSEARLTSLCLQMGLPVKRGRVMVLDLVTFLMVDA